MPIPIKAYVKELFGVISRMQKDYPNREFPPDGRLVGDIGEILAAQIYDLELFDGQQATHDAKSHGRLVQIKTTMKDKLTFGVGDVPEFYLGLQIDQNGDVKEIFNGPGRVIWNAISHRKKPKNGLYCISVSKLRSLNAGIKPEDSIRKR